MNQNQIQQLTSHLSQALDQNYDVVNMDAVLSVICALEGTTITKEQLEATRLAKYINQLRRRTKDEHLARRAKSLLKMWREMVGIQQTANDSQHHHSQHSSLPTPQSAHFYKYTAATTESNLAESVVHLPISPSVPSHRTISDLHSNIDSSEQPPTALPSQQHSNFANLINNISKFERDESNSSKSMQTHKQPQPHQFQTRSLGLPIPFINEQSLNSVSISSDVGNDKRSEASIVIDIVTDSDDNDNESASTIMGKSTIAASTPLTISPAPCIRPKKFKKDKKHKERVRSKSSLLANNELIGQQSRYNAKVKEGQSQTAQATDSEIFSLSNSSMSSILSGDAAILNSQHGFRPSSSELTFTGRFKTVNQSNTSNQDNSALPIGQNTVFRQNESERPIFEDSITNDSSTSCSRLSPPTVEERRKLDKVDDSIKQQNATSIQMPMPSIGLVHESNSRTEYLESSSKSQVPKKRGRKKGSKGVDAVIAKESSSLSQQIFFGVSSSVKKVKTTKELFSEIQSRKLITAVQSSTSNISNSSISRELTNRAPMPRPTSSCSDTSIHSPQIMDNFSGNVTLMGVDKFSIKNEDAANTDSDTITSEPSQDSNKSQEIKECTSLDSNSNSLQILSLAKTSMHTLKSDSYSDVTTQLMHLIHSIKGPVSVYEVEKLYRAQIVPCTCLVIEELSNPLGEAISLGSDDVAGDPKSDSNNDNVSRHKNQEEKLPKIERLSDNDILVDTPPKPVKSIFDLDFDEGEDPLQSIINDIRMPPIKLKETKENSDFNSSLAHLPLNIAPLDVASGNIDAVQNRVNCHNQEGETSEELNVAIPVFTCHEDPDCVAKQRFHVQTNQVNNFHINALHNFYIPNINGNWNSIDLSIVSESKITDFRSTYTVTDGADVVPKYGSLTYDRIRKDLSSMTFTRSFKTRHFKSKVPAFLGVAKCLPTCRLARRRIKKKPVKSPPTPLTVIPSTIEVSDLYPDNMQMNYNCASPLKVDVDIPVSDHENNTENNVQMQVNLETKSDATLSYNLLKLAKSKSLFEEAEPSDKGSEYENQNNSRLSSSSSSSCSNSSQSSNFSLKKTQDSINEKLRNQRSQRYRVQTIEPAQEETSRKRHGKNIKAIHLEENPPIKRIKISLNGKMSNLSSSNNSCSSESETETGVENDKEVENDYENNNDEEYAVVQRPMGGSSNNHIVMTIKKTPSKINSPANSISATSPINASETLNVRNSFFDPNRHNVPKSSTLIAPLYPTDYSKRILLSKKNRHPNRRRLYRLCRRKSDFKGRTIDLELKHLFTCKPNPDPNTVSDIKLHKKLFFNHELCKMNNAGRKQRILNYSSSSSSSHDDDESGFSSEESGAEAKKKVTTFEKYSLNIETDTSAERTVEDPLEKKIKEGPYLSSSSNDVNVSDSESEGDNHEVFDEVAEYVEDDTLNEVYNNGMLTSFNSICVEKQEMKEPTVMAVSGSVDAPAPQSTTSLALLQNENCDDVNNLCYNNNNLDVIKHSINTSSLLNDTIYKNVISNTSPRVLANNFSESIEQKIGNSELKPNKQSSVENQTGIRRTTLKDAALSSYADLDCTRIQQFKEWHQVLQLQSYNNEPLIVLPYVVLE